MSENTAIVVVNGLIILTIAGLSLAGFLCGYGPHGLWSILLALFMMSSSRPEKPDA